MGWLIREMGVADKERTVKWIRENRRGFISEGMRYAVEKMGREEKDSIMNGGEEK